jgi:saccharopine dehydrogenase-like NADP-dependent oxidoreductase
MKKLLILGAGAQGSTVAKRMDEEPNVSELIVADYDGKAVSDLAAQLTKAKPVQIDATKKEDIVESARGVDLLVNALPTYFGRMVQEVALEVETNYQDFALADAEGLGCRGWIECAKTMLTETSERFKAIGKTGLMSTGSAPGIINVVTANAVDQLDECETIYNFVWEGVIAKRFQPFWWSPQVAYGDMSDGAVAYENGEIIETEPFSRPMWVKFRHVDVPVRLVEHAHDEPLEMGINADKYLKGAKNIYFKYGGAGVEFAEPLYKMGMLSKKPVELNGQMVVPRELVLKLTPPAPKYHADIKEILDEGLAQDNGAMVVRAIGMKDGKKVMVESYVYAPGCVESFEKSGLTGEMYFTGQGGSLFTKLFVNDKITEPGMFTPEMLNAGQRKYYLEEAAKLEIAVETTIEEME